MAENRNVMVKIDNLTRKFGNFTAVDNISLDVYQGEVFGFLGANGAGKTTAIRVICGLLEPTGGDVFVNSISVKKNPELIKKQIGYMSQKFSLYKALSPDQNINFFGRIYGVSDQRIMEVKQKLRDDLKMKDLHKIITSDLPLGYKQRLGLQCALLHNPRIIFLDEPTSGVDPVGRRQFWDIIYQLSNEGKTIFVTTHYMDEAEYCNRMAIMSFGRVINLGTPEEIKQKYEAENLNDAFIEAIQNDRA
ncbi:MAG: ABC transporter ATP-binding protein [Calditrichia bacterium]|nr:ABC transporter ATP-binding protein [Calditrichia bacterium]